MPSHRRKRDPDATGDASEQTGSGSKTEKGKSDLGKRQKQKSSKEGSGKDKVK